MLQEFIIILSEFFSEKKVLYLTDHEGVSQKIQRKLSFEAKVKFMIYYLLYINTKTKPLIVGTNRCSEHVGVILTTTNP